MVSWDGPAGMETTNGEKEPNGVSLSAELAGCSCLPYLPLLQSDEIDAGQLRKEDPNCDDLSEELMEWPCFPTLPLLYPRYRWWLRCS